MTHIPNHRIPPPSAIIGLLLAAGRGSRFDNAESKLIQPCGQHDATVAELAAQALLPAIPVVAIVAAAGALADSLRRLGCEVILTDPSGPREMSATLRQGVLHTRDAPGWLVALADMPLVQPATIAAICAAMEAGADIAVPVSGSRRGHPVGFSARHRDALLALTGDQGARSILAAHAVTEVAVDDPGIFADIDTPADLQVIGRFK
ncbi:NTP transferase domain-containing protein [Herbaspirillum sp. alder98]|uniref:nucleotidyltransferase family protein n=1 Tax=Herbaspirillum sp. alder98 TaxID=2913096 RepID=UPI001CD854B4|nr:nucleotidyltransferase family protein [Herbaspirillum sp. alder98]MCA1326722.1 nucleotidyltransferase family protein [Herbaspirillum sp. alder98]